MTGRVPGRVPAVIYGLAGLLALYLILPFVAGLQQAGLADWRSVDLPTLEGACLTSAASASVATAVIAVCGIPLGYTLARVPGRAMAALGFLVQLPLALPPLSSGVLLLFLLGPYSPVSRLLGDVTDTFWGIVLAQTFVASPFLVIAARSAFGAVDPVLEDVAATLGHRALDRFLRVSLPLAWPATQAGLLLAWLRGFGEFGATVMVAYHPYSLPVYTYVAFGSQGLPAMLPVLLPTLVVAVAVMALSVAPRRRARLRRSGPATVPPLPAEDPGGAFAGGNIAGPDAHLAFQLRKRLGGFDLDLAWSPRARRLAILGPSGSGKSLTLRLLAGLERPEHGAVARIGCHDLSPLPPEARGIAYVPQNYGLLPDRTVLGQLLFPVGADRRDAARWIARLGLAGLEDRLPAELSLGQQQRVSLARALMRPARLLLLDEPFSALDTPLRARLRQELRALQRTIAATTIIVTHDPEEALLLADEVLVIDAGRVLQSGRVDDVASRPASEHVAALLGAERCGAGVVIASDRIAIGDDVTLLAEGATLPQNARVAWSVRREFVRLSSAGAYQGEVEAVTRLPGADEITLRLGHGTLRALAEPGGAPPSGPCRFDIHPRAVQAWLLDGR